MPLFAFETCRERIRRAKTHAEAFARLWSDLIADESEVYSSVLHIDDDGRGSLWIAPRFEAGLPSQFALELGEFLYQLRGALDACVYAAAISESRQDPPPDAKYLEFPVCDSEADFKKAGWKIRPLTGMRRQIIEDVQPYKTPTLRPELYVLNFNRTIKILHDWARIDRHRRMHVIGGWASQAAPKLWLPPGVDLEWITVANDGLLEHEGEVASFKLSGYVPGSEPKVKANPDVFIDVTVNEAPPPCHDKDTLSNRMRFMPIVVGEIVRAMEQSFIDERKPGVGGKPIWGN